MYINIDIYIYMYMYIYWYICIYIRIDVYIYVNVFMYTKKRNQKQMNKRQRGVTRRGSGVLWRACGKCMVPPGFRSGLHTLTGGPLLGSFGLGWPGWLAWGLLFWVLFSVSHSEVWAGVYTLYSHSMCRACDVLQLM